MNASVTLTKQQIASLLANAFFCTFPRRNSAQDQYEYRDFPTINMSTLFQRSTPLDKLRFILNYFDRVGSHPPAGSVTFTRHALHSLPDWETSTVPIRMIKTSPSGLIEDARGCATVDFSNKMLGGGVLGRGTMQEEIYFLTHPELIVGRLFCASLDDNESIVVTGAERYSKYSGYGHTLKFEGDFVDTSSRDERGRPRTTLIAMDALDFSQRGCSPGVMQHHTQATLRELNKAYCTFSRSPPNVCIATGHWGCGVFCGSRPLKAAVQVMAASQSGRDLLYFTQEETFDVQLSTTISTLVAKHVSVGQVWNALCAFFSLVEQQASLPAQLFGFLVHHFK
eukprot:TRINITY_DN741_c0_g1_i6.p1 TRINITY_DN741_c0_g1~~TRINITY_DN741_c0_g1_i6.p1  ORF type:complete len:339 (-),score=59.00 TRINITY_DN741_c0_g1_i6:29-1045(-)